MSGDKTFMRIVFEATAEAVTSKESDIEDMIANYKKGNAAQQASKSKETDVLKGLGGSAPGKKSQDAMSTEQSLELQFEMGQYTQMATAGSNIVKMIKDLQSLVIRNIA